MKKNTSSFASRWGFILASVGSAVGMANVWGFPNKMGERRRGVPAHISAVRVHFQLCRAAGGIRYGAQSRYRHSGNI